MKIHVVGGSGGMSPGRMLTTFRINDSTILDAGSVAQALTLDEQVAIEHVLLTHAHLDHSGTLPFMVDNIFGMRDTPFLVHGIPETMQSIREHLFNDDIWPNFAMLPDMKRAQIRFEELVDGEPAKLGALTVTAIRVHHTIPAVGFLLEQGDTAVLFSGDTGPTDRLWQVASSHPNLKAAFVEASFPNRMQGIADISGHLTPQTLAAELDKLDRDLPVFAYHIKPRYHDDVAAELKSLGRRVEVVEQNAVYRFT